MIAALNPQWWWYVARASGLVAWLMLTASMVWGILLATKAFPSYRRPAWLRDLHVWLSALTLGFVAVHLGALVADNYIHFGLVDLLVPFAASWKPAPVALGVIALWLLAAVGISSALVRRIPRRTWRRIHLTSYGVFWLTTLHAAFAGSDASNSLYRVSALVVVCTVAWASMYRAIHRSTRGGARGAGVGRQPLRTNGGVTTVPSSNVPRRSI